MIEIKNLSKSYSSYQALTNLNLEIPKGEIFGLLGPNGAGKTTFIRLLTQITKPDSGSILFEGRELTKVDAKRMGYLPEERGLYRKMKVSEQLLFLAELKGLSTNDAKQNLKYWVDKFEIAGWLGKKLEELSKGMQQKVQFIATVLHNPDILILDEPFSGFDPINSHLLVDEILQLKAKGTTIIFSTHRMDSVELLCDSIALIHQSKKVLDGRLNEVKSRYRSNQFLVAYEGIELSDNQSYLVSSSPDKNGWQSVLTMKQQMSSNELLKLLLQQDIQLFKFEEKLPTMDEIFIKAVEQLGLQQSFK